MKLLHLGLQNASTSTYFEATSRSDLEDTKVHIFTYMYIYIYNEREREREFDIRGLESLVWHLRPNIQV